MLRRLSTIWRRLQAAGAPDPRRIPAKDNPSKAQRWVIGEHRNIPVEVGRFTYGYENIVVIDGISGEGLAIGQFCSISSDVTISLGNNHRTDWVTTFPMAVLGLPPSPGHPYSRGGVVIGNDVWIGRGVTIMSGVQIGDGAVLAARSHVVKNVPPYTIVGGNPARIIRQRFPQDIIDLLTQFGWWNRPIDEIRGLAPLLAASPDADELRAMLRASTTIPSPHGA